MCLGISHRGTPPPPHTSTEIFLISPQYIFRWQQSNQCAYFTTTGPNFQPQPNGPLSHSLNAQQQLRVTVLLPQVLSTVGLPKTWWDRHCCWQGKVRTIPFFSSQNFCNYITTNSTMCRDPEDHMASSSTLKMENAVSLEMLLSAKLHNITSQKTIFWYYEMFIVHSAIMRKLQD